MGVSSLVSYYLSPLLQYGPYSSSGAPGNFLLHPICLQHPCVLMVASAVYCFWRSNGSLSILLNFSCRPCWPILLLSFFYGGSRFQLPGSAVVPPQFLLLSGRLYRSELPALVVRSMTLTTVVGPRSPISPAVLVGC